LSGAKGALQVWIDMMKSLRPRSLTSQTPNGVEWAWTDLQQGLITETGCPGAVRFPYMRGSEPRRVQCGGLRAGAAPAQPG
jgi:penicillin-binding protein 1B